MKSTLNTTSCHSELVSESPAVSEKIGRPSLKGNLLGLNKFRVTNFYAFTLVELIVVITILVILGTIAFTSLSGYSGSARDGSRVSDLANLSKSLDIVYAKTSAYPSPDNAFTVTYSGWTLWYQGTIGDSVINIIGTNGAKISKKPTDPLNTTKEYTYSKLAYGNAYQIKTDWEGDAVAYLPSSSGLTRGSNLAESRFVPNGSFGWIPAFAGMTNIGIDQAQAASGNPTLTYIKGTYNGVVARTETGTTKYVLAIPSLFLATGTGVVVLSATTSTGFSLHGQTNSGGILFRPNMVFSSGALPSTDPERQALATSIANAYSGTILASQSNIQSFITAISPVNTGSLVSLGGSAVTNWLGGSTSTIQTPPPPPAANPLASCAIAWTILAASTTYTGCNTADIIVCTGNGTGQIWSACNAGATTAWTAQTLASASAVRDATVNTWAGGLYQWGNSTEVSYAGTTASQVTCTNTPNGSSSATFRTPNTDWCTAQSDDLWGHTTNTNIARKGPCATDYHVPAQSEWASAVNAITGKASGWVAWDVTTLQNAMKLPMPSNRTYSDGSMGTLGTGGYYWSSSPSTTYGYFLHFYSAAIYPAFYNVRAYGFSVRCLKN